MESLIRLISRTIIRYATYRSLRRTKGMVLVFIVGIAITAYLMTGSR